MTQALNLNSMVAPATVRNSDGARRGMFTVALPHLEPGNVDFLKGLFDGMVVLHTETSHFEGVTRYYALHDSFDPVRAGDRTPEYSVIVEAGEDGDAPKFHFDKVEQVSML